MKERHTTIVIFNHPLTQVVLTIVLAAISVSSQTLSIRSDYKKGDFKLVQTDVQANIIVSPEDFKVVQIAARDFAADVERVTGKKLSFSDQKSANAVIIGTLGKNPLIDGLVKRRRLDVSPIRGKWESFIIATVKDPSPNIENALIIVGSDRRGTAFGVYEMSQMIGVSPWYWWADVAPEHKDNLVISPGRKIGREPSVKYRGIFLNDEDWGLQPWAAKTFEPETGDIGPKTYAKVFELLLRLKANTLWPAMHEVTRAFNSFRENPKVADDHAIVMGSSHAEPMLRSNTTEWKADKNDFNFVTNAQGVTAYWEERVRENGKFENIYTIGMRGIHDSPLIGTKSQAERIPLLESIFGIQRGLMAKHTGRPAETIPQIFCPYKEVLADYRAGLRVQDDVTIVFPDDNFGFIRQFPTAEERKRKGGFGVYYHISYLGRPLSYLWLTSTPPALIFEEMSKAYENGMRNLWIVNVGDIKPGEIGMEFFLQMAYDAKKWNVENQHRFLLEWAKREFGQKHAIEIAGVMNEYYRLGFQRKPEHLQWYLPTEAPKKSDFSNTEVLERLAKYSEIRQTANGIFNELPANKRDSFYELVVYPIRSASLANERFFAAEIAQTYGVNSPSTGREWAKRSLDADQAIAAETAFFNEKLAGGKWRHIMSPEMGPDQWKSMRSTPPKVSPTDFYGVETENSFRPLGVQPFRAGTRESTSIFNEWNGTISIEAENFVRRSDRDGFSWRTIKGLGKTGDSISIFPAVARSFDISAKAMPSVEYYLNVSTAAEFTFYFHLIPTQPLMPGNGLRLAFSIDGEKPTVVVVDKDTEVSSRKWAQNILDETTVGSERRSLTNGRHALSIFAVDSGVVFDKIVIASRELDKTYFGPRETRFEWLTRSKY